MRYYFIQRLEKMILIKSVLITPFLSVIDRFPKGSSLAVIKKLFIYNNVLNIADILNQLKASAINSYDFLRASGS